MSNKYCCVTWQELGPEMVEDKTTSISLLMNDKGLPRSVFAAVFKVLDGMMKHCPVCGSNLSGQIEVEELSEERSSAKPVSTQAKRICNKCRGKRILGYDKDKIPIKCMNCLGDGFIKRGTHLPTQQSFEDLSHADANKQAKQGADGEELKETGVVRFEK